MPASFCLVDEPWIPCRFRDGTVRDTGIRETLQRAHEIAEIVDASPLVTSALFRLMLVILHRVLEGPADERAWEAIWKQDALDPLEIDRYLDAWKPRLNLLSPDYPFFQIADLSIVDKAGAPVPPAPITTLAPELASGNNTTLFDHSLDESPLARSPAWVARALVATQAWGLGGGKGPRSNLWEHPYASHAPLVGALQVFIVRPTLRETLLINLTTPEARDGRLRELGTPIWERDGYRAPTGEELVPEGLLDLMTFPARYLRVLSSEQEGDASIRHLYLAPGLKADRSLRDPYTCWRPGSKKESLVPVGLRVGRSVWRDSGALFAWREGERESDAVDLRAANLRQAGYGAWRTALSDQPVLDVNAIGLANDKAKALIWEQANVPCALRVATDPDASLDLLDALDRVERAWQSLRRAVRYLVHVALSTDQKSPDRQEVDRKRDSLLDAPDFWVRVGDGFAAFMRGLDEAPEEALACWMRSVCRIARQSFQRASDRLPVPLARRLHAHALAFPRLSWELSELVPDHEDEDTHDTESREDAA